MAVCAAPGRAWLYLLCRSAQRKEKEQAMHERFEKRIEEGLEKISGQLQKTASSCRLSWDSASGDCWARTHERRERLKSRSIPMQTALRSAAGKESIAGGNGARLSEGCYVLRSNVTDGSPEELWRAYMQLTEAEAAFRIQSRSATATDLAPETRAGRGARPGVLSGLCVVEDTGATLPTRRVGQRTTKSIPGIGGHHPGRRCVTDAKRSNDPKTLHQSTDRAPGDSVATPEFAPSSLARNGPSVVKTRVCPH